MRSLLVLLFVSSTVVGEAQDIRFARTPAQAEAENRTLGAFGLCVDSLVIDTVYYENAATGTPEPTVQRYPLARYEYYADQALYRRIDIRHEQVLDTTVVLDLRTGEFIDAVDSTQRDVPSGAYHEFFPNGNIHVKGRLNGFDEQGRPRKTGEWMEWDANGRVIRRESYP